jgi:hypothetical protein
MTDLTPDTAAPFDPEAVAAAARGDEVTPSLDAAGNPLTGQAMRQVLAGLTASVPTPAYPIFRAAHGRPEFAAIASAVAVSDEATRRREDAQDAYEAAEDAYGLDLAAWERAQADTAAAMAAGGKLPTKIAPRPAPAAYEAKADLLARVAGEARKAEVRAVMALNEACRKSARAIPAYAAERQRALAPDAREKLSVALAVVTELIDAHHAAYGARICQEAARLAEASGLEPVRAHHRIYRERVAQYVAEAFYSREADKVEGAARDGMSALRRLVEALAVEDFGGPWPDGGDPADQARATSAARAARDRAEAASWQDAERRRGETAANMGY